MPTLGEGELPVAVQVRFEYLTVPTGGKLKAILGDEAPSFEEK